MPSGIHTSHSMNTPTAAQVTWMPCLGDTGLALFSTTADQRAALGDAVFLATHHPITLRWQETDLQITRMTQEELLTRLMAEQGVAPGNRVFVLYGAAGAGKSELLQWLVQQITLRHPARSRGMVRVSRTELDVVQIVERFHSRLSGRYFSAQTHARWGELHSKPLTLAKLLVLSALERLLQHDDQITALFYWLAAPVQRNLEKRLSEEASDADPTFLELFSDEDWVELQRATELSTRLDLESLREALAAAFRGLLLENVHLPETMRLLSAEIMQQHGVRPLLLIDDMVRSLNLFAGDLMDYLITLEEGDWDVVMGVTPASLQTHGRGRQFLERIAYLDTVDDRVQKLWLSDELGQESYFLDEGNCVDFAARYLAAYRRLNGVACQTCTQYTRCRGLGQAVDVGLLAPFNAPALLRVFRALPAGKGKARYFLRALAAILQQAHAGAAMPDLLKRYSLREFVARCESPREAALAETYANVTHDAEIATVAPGVARFFAQPVAPEIAIETLTSQLSLPVSAARDGPPAVAEDPELGAIRRWLEGEAANRQLLLTVRQGIARWLRTVGPPHVLTRHGVAKPHGVLRWEMRYLDVTPPILLDDVDAPQLGLSIQRTLGFLAFDFAKLAKARGDSARVLATTIAADAYAANLLQAARDLRGMLFQRLEEQLSMSPELLALHTAIFVLCLDVDAPPIPGLPPRFQSWLAQRRTRGAAWRSELDAATHRALLQLFDDFFKLRENLVDGARIARLSHAWDDDGWLGPLLTLRPATLDPAFTLGGRPLADTLGLIQSIVAHWQGDASESELSPSSAAAVEALHVQGKRGVPLTTLSPEVLAELAAIRPEVYTQLKVWIDPPA